MVDCVFTIKYRDIMDLKKIKTFIETLNGTVASTEDFDELKHEVLRVLTLLEYFAESLEDMLIEANHDKEMQTQRIEAPQLNEFVNFSDLKEGEYYDIYHSLFEKYYEDNPYKVVSRDKERVTCTLLNGGQKFVTLLEDRYIKYKPHKK